MGVILFLEIAPGSKIDWNGSQCCLLLISGPLSGGRSNFEIREGGSDLPIIVHKHAAVEVEIRLEGAPEGLCLIWFPIIWFWGTPQ